MSSENLDSSHEIENEEIDISLWIRVFVEERNTLSDASTTQRYAVLVSMTLIIGSLLLRTFLRRPFVLVVINCILILAGFAIGCIIRVGDIHHEFELSKPSLFFISIFLVLHIFQATHSLDRHTFWRDFWEILLMAVVNVAVQMSVFLFIAYALMNRSRDWNWFTVLFFTGIVCPSDNYFMRSAINSAQGHTKKLLHFLQAETVLTAGISIFLIHSLRYLNEFEGELTGSIIARSVFFGMIGIFIGILFGFLTKIPIKYACQDYKEFFLLSFGLPNFVYFFCRFMHTAAIPSILVVGIILTGYKIRLTSEVESFLNTMWAIIHFLLSLCVHVGAGAVLALIEHDCDLTDLGFIIAFYCLSIFVRSVGCVIISNFIMSPQITWKHIKLIIWANAKGTINILLAWWCLTMGSYYTHQIFLYVVCLSCLSTFFNGVLVRPYMKMEGLFDFSRPKLINMNMAVAQINQCREQALIALKSDRVIADANWHVVEHLSRLEHPYKKFLKNMAVLDILDTKHEMRTLECNVCGTEIPAPLSKKEFDEIIVEAKHRVLKALMVCFLKQYESGTLSLGAVTTLGGLVDAATIKDDPVLFTADLKIQREGSLSLRAIHRCLTKLMSWTSFNHYNPSKNFIRSCCYSIVTSSRFQMMTATLSLLDSLVIVLLIRTYFKTSYTSVDQNLAWFAQLADIVFWIIFMVEFLLCIIGLGPNQFFSYTINKIEFGSNVFIRTVEVGMYIDMSLRDGYNINVLEFPDGVLIYLKIFLLLRCIRIYSFASAFLPKLLNSVENQLEEDLLRSYDIGKAYLVALDRITKYLGRIVGTEMVVGDLKKIIDDERQKISKELGLIQKDNPIIAITVKTRHAIRQVVNTMNDCIIDMKEEGILDMNETKSLMSALEDVRKNLKGLERVKPSPPEYILRKIAWLARDEDSTMALLKSAVLCNYDYNDVILNYGDDPVGLYIVISGMVRSSYKPMASTLQLSSKFGVLPNYDFFSNLKLTETQEEYVVAGNVIGELGVVTGRRYDMVITCETAVQLYFVPWEVVKAVVHDSERGEEIKLRIWKVIGIRIGTILLQYKTQFQSWEREKLLMYLQRGVVPALTDVYTLVFRPELFDDVILIEGVVMDPVSREIFFAPYLLPATASRVILPEHRNWDFQTVYQTRIMVIPNATVTELDLFGVWGLYSENFQDDRVVSAPPPVADDLRDRKRSPSGTPSGRGGGELKYKRKVGFQGHQATGADEESLQMTESDKKTD